MAIRRQRRRLFASIVTKNEQIDKKFIDLTEKLQKIVEERDLESRKYQNEILTLKTRTEKERQHLIHELEDKHHVQLDQVRKRYEEKIHMIGGKLQEIELEKGKKDSKNAIALASDMARNAAKELENKVEKRMTELKDALLAVSEREKAALKELSVMRAENDVSQSKIKHLEAQVQVRIIYNDFEI